MAAAEAQAKKKSDLGARTASAVVMVGLAAGAALLGGWWWLGFVVLIGAGILWEWQKLVLGFVSSPLGRGAWAIAGIVYVGVTVVALIVLRDLAWPAIIPLIVLVVATDVGAYFAGRAIGGPKIAPRISPSKTWAGLAGGMVFAAVSVPVTLYVLRDFSTQDPTIIDGITSAGLATVAQVGDFFESWMKRKAGVKDSGNLIPGHGGLFDRFDGLLAVTFVLGVLSAISMLAPPVPTHVENVRLR